MTVSITEDPIYGSAWCSPQAYNIYCHESVMADNLKAIGMLALCQADLGIIPKKAGLEIKEKALSGLSIDWTALKKAYVETNHSMAGLINFLKKALRSESRPWIFYGATVQDITDTSMVMRLKKSYEILQENNLQLFSQLRSMAIKYKATPMAGRTHGQVGLPQTFGFKCAGWLNESANCWAAFHHTSKSAFQVQLGGGIGSGSIYGTNLLALRSKYAQALELGDPPIAWINARSSIINFLSALSSYCQTQARMATEIVRLQSTECNEVRESSSESSIGSITMLHKRNPEKSEQVVTLGKSIASNLNALQNNVLHTGERDGIRWKLEWKLIPEIMISAITQAELTVSILKTLEVSEQNMKQNLSMGGNIAYHEAALIALIAEGIDPDQAKDTIKGIFEKYHSFEEGWNSYVTGNNLRPNLKMESLFSYNLESIAKQIDAVVLDADGKIGKSANNTNTHQ